MATITSASTRAQVLDAIADNASYSEDGSVSKCRAYITALRVFLRRWAFEETRSGGHYLRYNTANAEGDLHQAEAWLRIHTDYGGIKQLSVSGFRE
jgi:hypothetical protein